MQAINSHGLTIHTVFQIFHMENQNSQLLLLRLLRIISSLKYVVGIKKYLFWIYLLTYTSLQCVSRSSWSTTTLDTLTCSASHIPSHFLLTLDNRVNMNELVYVLSVKEIVVESLKFIGFNMEIVGFNM